jgi:hypothetical protein
LTAHKVAIRAQEEPREAMAKITKASIISDIEYIVDAPSPAIERRSWQVQGVECLRDRHRFSGQSYSFTIDVLQVRLVRSGRTIWRLAVVTEGWRVAEGDRVLQQNKWLKMINGKASDVMEWVQRCRAQKLQEDRPTSPRAERGRTE